MIFWRSASRMCWVKKLLGSLDSLATESRHRDFDFQQVAGLGSFVEFLGFRNKHVAFVHSLDFFGGHVRIVVREVIHDFDAEHHVDSFDSVSMSTSIFVLDYGGTSWQPGSRPASRRR
jgi:hypothetical protein